MNGKVTFRRNKRDEKPEPAPVQQTVTVASMPDMEAPPVEPTPVEDNASNFRQAVMEIFSVPDEPIAVEDPEMFEVLPPQAIEQTIVVQEDQRDLPEVTYIAPGTRITGSISVDGDAEVYGHIEGHVDCGRNLRLNGRVDGGFSAENAEVFDSQVTGDISIRQSLATRGNVLIKGNVTGDSIDFFGKLKGDVSAGNVLIIRKDSAVMGDVSSQSLYIEMGAVVQGKVNVVTELMSDLDDLD